MCGALALLVPVTGRKLSQRVISRMTYNAGRLLTYAVLGALFGLFGKAFAIAGLQRWFSITAGLLIIFGLVLSTRSVVSGPMARGVAWLKPKFGALLRKRTLASIAGLGVLNGLLPCGLVYIACAGSATTGNVFGAVKYMIAFGLGTMPMLLAIGIGGASINLSSLRLNRLVPTVAVIAGMLLILRGLALGIPYVSPALSGQCPACVQ